MDRLQEKVGYEQRRARARRMHTLTRKLVRQKKLLASRYASKEKLHARAQRLARELLRKRIAGSRGANYSKLSTSQRIEIDKMIDSLPKSLRKGLSNRLVPYVTKAETVRVTKYRSRKKLKESKSIDTPLEQGTPELTKRYKEMTPGQKTIETVKKVVSEAIISGSPARRRFRTVGSARRIPKVTKPVPGQKGSLTNVQRKRAEQGKRAGAKYSKRGQSLSQQTAQRTAKSARSAVLKARQAREHSRKMQQARRNINPN